MKLPLALSHQKLFGTTKREPSRLVAAGWAMMTSRASFCIEIAILKSHD